MQRSLIITLLLLVIGCRLFDKEPESLNKRTPPKINSKAVEALESNQKELVDAKLLKIQNFKIQEIELKNNKMPLIRFKKDPRADYVAFSACPKNKKCIKGSLLTNNHIIPGLPEGIIDIKVRACVFTNRAQEADKLCGPSKSNIFLKQPTIRKRLDELLSRKIQLQEQIKDLGPPTYKAIKLYQRAVDLCTDENVKKMIVPKVLHAYKVLGPELIGIGLLDPNAEIAVEREGHSKIVVLSEFGKLEQNSMAQIDPGNNKQEFDDDSLKDEAVLAAKVSFAAGAFAIVAPALASVAAKVAGKKIGIALSEKGGKSFWKNNLTLSLGTVALLSFATYILLDGDYDLDSFTTDFLEKALLLAPETKDPCDHAKTSVATIFKIDAQAKAWRKEIILTDELLKKEM